MSSSKDRRKARRAANTAGAVQRVAELERELEATRKELVSARLDEQQAAWSRGAVEADLAAARHSLAAARTRRDEAEARAGHLADELEETRRELADQAKQVADLHRLEAECDRLRRRLARRDAEAESAPENRRALGLFFRAEDPT